MWVTFGQHFPSIGKQTYYIFKTEIIPHVHLYLLQLLGFLGWSYFHIPITSADVLSNCDYFNVQLLYIRDVQ